MKTRLFIFISTIFSSAFSQDIHFTQFQNTRGYLNPAMAGTDSTLVINSGARLQWPNLEGSYSSVHLSTDKYFTALKGGLGLNLLYDNAARGIIKTSCVTLNYAPHFELFDHKLAIQPGIGFGFRHKKLDTSKLTFGDMIDDRSGFIYNTNENFNNKNQNFDLNAGIFMYTKSIYGGFALHHLTEPDEGFRRQSKLPIKLAFHGGANFEVNEKIVICPNVLYIQQGPFKMLMPGVTAKIRSAILGMSCRNTDAFNILTGLQFRSFKAGYSYDYTISSLTNKSGGSHEIQLSYFLDSKKRSCKIKTIRMI